AHAGEVVLGVEQLAHKSPLAGGGPGQAQGGEGQAQGQVRKKLGTVGALLGQRQDPGQAGQLPVEQPGRGTVGGGGAAFQEKEDRRLTAGEQPDDPAAGG